MKKYSLLKALGICFFVLIVLSFILPTGTFSGGTFTKATTEPIGFFEWFSAPMNTIINYGMYGIIFLLIGGLYGVLNKTGVYTKVVDDVKKKYEGKEKKFLTISILVFAVLASLTGLNIALFILVPFMAAIILKLGFSKVTAMLSTVGALLVGMIGSTYGFNVCGYINYYFSLDVNNAILVKVAFLAILVIFYNYMIRKSAKVEAVAVKADTKASEVTTKKVTKETKKTTKAETKKSAKTTKTTKKAATKKTTTKKKNTKKNTMNEAVKDDVLVVPLYKETETKKKKSAVPMIVIMAIMFILVLVGMYNWRYAFNIDIFEKSYESMMGVEVNGYPIVQNILGYVNPIGYFTVSELASILILAAFLIGWIYNLKFKEILDAFIEGMKEMLPTAFYAALANIVMAVIASSSTGGNIFFTMSDWLLNITKGFNAITTSVVAALGGLFYNDMPYLVNSLADTMISKYTNSALYPLFGLIFQSMHGLVMMIVPTSMILIAGLSYLKVSYKEWFKNIWKILLGLLVITIIAITVLFLIVK